MGKRSDTGTLHHVHSSRKGTKIFPCHATGRWLKLGRVERGREKGTARTVGPISRIVEGHVLLSVLPVLFYLPCTCTPARHARVDTLRQQTKRDLLALALARLVPHPLVGHGTLYFSGQQPTGRSVSPVLFSKGNIEKGRTRIDVHHRALLLAGARSEPQP